MDVTLQIFSEKAQALALAPDLEAHADEISGEYRLDPLPADTCVGLVERHWGQPQTVVAIAHTTEGERLAACVTVPLEDPLSGEKVPIVVLLEVHPDYRHRGLARSLVGAVRTELESRGEQRIAARAAHNDDAIISMGERWGFTRVWELMVRE
jgi:GNAT superfamily N-acetyltransferase